MMDLLVSVRDADEARLAVSGGAALIDVKEPRGGSLGCAGAAVLRGVFEAVSHCRPLSAALGELLYPPSPPVLAALAGYQFAKVGLAGTGSDRGWKRRWRDLIRQFPPATAPVAVIYADWRQCRAPSPEEIVETAKQLACPAALFDTYHKGGGNLFSTMTLEEIEGLVGGLRSSGLRVVLAGGIEMDDLTAIAPLRPDLVGVRGAVCVGGREGALAETRVAQWAKQLRETASLRFRTGTSADVPPRLGRRRK